MGCAIWQAWHCQLTVLAVPRRMLALSAFAVAPMTAKAGDSSLKSDQLRSLVSFLEHEPQPMIVLDTDYQILAANAAYQRQFCLLYTSDAADE